MRLIGGLLIVAHQSDSVRTFVNICLVFVPMFVWVRAQWLHSQLLMESCCVSPVPSNRLMEVEGNQSTPINFVLAF